MTDRPKKIRQGDVLLELVEEVPSDAVKQSLDRKLGLVLALGEVTGHSHRVPRRSALRGAAAYRTEDDARYMRVTAPVSVPLRHEEHKTVCATCLLAGVVAVATMRRAGKFGRDAYVCSDHAIGLDVVALSEPGCTDVPTGTWRVSIHGEYQPGELRSRSVED